MDFNNFVSPRENSKLCQNKSELISDSGEKFKIKGSIPRFIELDNYANAFGIQWNKFQKTQLDSYSKTNISEKRLETCFGFPLTELKDKKILEAGSGSGRFTEILLKYGAIVYSFDLSNAVEANYRNNMPNDNLTLFQADIREIPFDDEFFDFSLCIGVLQHTPNTVDSIKELNRVLKKNGMLVIDHYKFHLGHFFSLYLVYWVLIKNLKQDIQFKVTNYLTEIFFPIHWFFRKSKVAQFLLRRISPISFYYGILDLSQEQHFEWSQLDTHDKNTDFYKRHYTYKKFNKILKENFNFSSIKIYERGNGLECIAIK